MQDTAGPRPNSAEARFISATLAAACCRRMLGALRSSKVESFLSRTTAMAPSVHLQIGQKHGQSTCSFGWVKSTFISSLKENERGEATHISIGPKNVSFRGGGWIIAGKEARTFFWESAAGCMPQSARLAKCGIAKNSFAGPLAYGHQGPPKRLSGSHQGKKSAHRRICPASPSNTDKWPM